VPKTTRRERQAITQAVQQQNAVARSQILTQVTLSGPLPPPQQLMGYEQALPGSAERIMKMAEKQAEHRQELETKGLDHMIARSNRGLTTARNIQIVFLGASVLLIATGHDAAGAVIGGVDLVGMTTMFIYGSASGRNERLKRARLLSGQDEDGA
jgi:uncharacterized membrane protein